MKKLLYYFVCGVLCLISVEARSQSSMLQDSKGESSFKVFGNSLVVNAQDKSISTNMDVFKKDSLVFNRFGFNLKFNSKEGIANLKNSEGFFMDGEVGGYYGRKKTLQPNPKDVNAQGWTREWYISLNVLFDKSKLFDISRPTNKLTYYESNFGVKLETGFFGYKGNVLWGINANICQKTNADEIKARTVSQLIYSGNNDSTRVFKEEMAYNSNEFNSKYRGVNINGDIAFLLNRNSITNEDSKVPPLYLAIHLRYNYFKDQNSKFIPAIGIYAAKKGNPRSIIFGTSLQLDDMFNADNSKNNAWERTLVNLTAGYQF